MAEEVLDNQTLPSAAGNAEAALVKFDVPPDILAMLVALQFYADKQNYKQTFIPSRGFSVSETIIDGGKRARAALAKAEPSR